MASSRIRSLLFRHYVDSEHGRGAAGVGNVAHATNRRHVPDIRTLVPRGVPADAARGRSIGLWLVSYAGC